MHVSALHLYPIKGAGGIPVSRRTIGPLGLDGDRRWMLVDPSGRFLSQRRIPAMALLHPALVADPAGPAPVAPDPAGFDPAEPAPREAGGEAGRLRVTFTSPEAPSPTSLFLPLVPRSGPILEVEIWGDRVEALAPDPDADAWFSEVLGHPCRAVFVPEEALRPVDPDHAPGHRVAFADGYPLLVATDAGLAELNRRLPRPLPMARFRPNLVVAGASAPHAEDGWRQIRVGDVAIRLVKPCARCTVTTVDPTTGRLDGPEPLRTLAKYRRREGQVFFGQNGVVEGGGILRVGDPVRVEESGAPLFRE
jgi:uncharacterized protein